VCVCARARVCVRPCVRASVRACLNDKNVAQTSASPTHTHTLTHTHTHTNMQDKRIAEDVNVPEAKKDDCKVTS